MLLRKKKHQETLLERTDKQLDNLEQLTHDIEFAQVERQVLDGLKSGNEVKYNHNSLLTLVIYRVSHPIVGEIPPCFVLGVPLACLGSS